MTVFNRARLRLTLLYLGLMAVTLALLASVLYVRSGLRAARDAARP